MRYNTSAVNSAPTSRKFKEARIHENNKYTSPYHIPKTRVKKSHKMHKSRSHEHILDSSTDESMYRERQSQSLPRGRRKTPDVSAKNLGTQGAWSNYSIHKNSDIIQRLLNTILWITCREQILRRNPIKNFLITAAGPVMCLPLFFLGKKHLPRKTLLIHIMTLFCDL